MTKILNIQLNFEAYLFFDHPLSHGIGGLGSMNEPSPKRSSLYLVKHLLIP
jgi:hypothetical protein